MIKAAILTKTFFMAGAALAGGIAAAQPSSSLPNNPIWTQVVPPFRIADGLYYVGSRDIGVYLVDGGRAGLILIDAGMPEFAPQVLKNVRTLGFDPAKIRILLNSQAHVDHAGGLAAIKAATGARLMASKADAPLLEAGGKGDFFFGDEVTFPAAKVDSLVRDGQAVTLGRATLTAHLTPGHSKGCTTWTMPVSISGRTHVAQFNCSMTIPGYTLLGNPHYPNIVEDYRASFDKLRRVPCDVFLASHGSFFDLDGKRAKLTAGRSKNPFIDPEGCRRYLDVTEKRFQDQLAREQAGAGVVHK
ncbi:MAG: subclass B3 metallo-beta-lactamase [Pseudomonadota bacterium]|nr:subclass B3 metallo-beta-lactamase [Pseudomonadota bacterium]